MAGHFSRTLVVAAIVGVLTSVRTEAQVTTGVVTGTVHDQQGGVLPGAAVALISATRATRVADTQTKPNGDFVFPNVPGDTYVVEVSSAGLRTLRRGGV